MYRFFDQLEALENTPPPSFNPPPPRSASMPAPSSNLPTVSSTSPDPLSVVLPIQSSMSIGSSPFQPPPLQMPLQPPAAISIPQTHKFQRSRSTSSDEDIQMRRGKKRKWKEFFHILMKDVIHKQKELQKKFLDTLEKRKRDQMVREEAWRNQKIWVIWELQS